MDASSAAESMSSVVNFFVLHWHFVTDRQKVQLNCQKSEVRVSRVRKLFIGNYRNLNFRFSRPTGVGFSESLR